MADTCTVKTVLTAPTALRTVRSALRRSFKTFKALVLPRPTARGRLRRFSRLAVEVAGNNMFKTRPFAVNTVLLRLL
jgi:hypothetical protein